jgi:hypothetical protein
MTVLNATYTSPAPVAIVPPSAGSTPTVINTPGAAILHAPHSTTSAADAALKSLRGFKAARRRIVWCNTTDLVRHSSDPGKWGGRLVDQGGADMVVVAGVGAREIAIAARDAGLPLGRVVVCRDDATARNVLGDSMTAGDAVLALAVDADSCRRLAERLESKFEHTLAAAH